MFGALLTLFRKRCPACGSQSLRVRNWIRANLADDNGKRHADSWTYESCDACSVRLKRYVNGRLETPSPDEWDLHVEKDKIQ